MAANVTLAEMMRRTRELANQETNSGADSLVSDKELRQRLNEALATLYDKLIAAYPQEHFVSSTTFSTVVDQNSYDLPTDFYKLLAVVLQNGQVYAPVPIWRHEQLADLLRSQHMGRGNLIYNMFYRIVKDKLVLRPAPKVVWTCHLHYIPAFQPFATDGSDDSDTFDGVNGWEKWACLNAAIYCMQKEETDPSPLLTMLSMEDARLHEMISTRDQGQPECIVDVAGGSEYRLHRNFWLLRLPPA